jgi:hypothetical protein
LRWEAPGWSILVRLLVGLVVFLPEGLQKLIFPDVLGPGRFARIGIPFPDVMGPFVGVVETVCGALIILGLFTRLAAIPLINYHDRGSHLDQAPDLALGTIYGFSILLRTSSARVCGA